MKKVEFLRTYLQIEEARFGERLRVEILIASDVAGEHIPSLILQPIVENALKHGLAPKVGPGCLRISAQLQGDRVCLKVEDDGIGALHALASPRRGLCSNRRAARQLNGSGAGTAERRRLGRRQ